MREGVCAAGIETCVRGAWGACSITAQAAESACDGRDEDCDGRVDEDVGAMLGITTETASRTVASFRREGMLIDMDRQGRFFRIDATALHAAANGSE